MKNEFLRLHKHSYLIAKYFKNLIDIIICVYDITIVRIRKGRILIKNTKIFVIFSSSIKIIFTVGTRQTTYFYISCLNVQ